MSAFQNLRIANKLFVVNVGILLLTVFVGVFAIWRMAVLNDEVEELTTNWGPSVATINDYKSGLNAFRRFQLARLIAADEAAEARADKGLADSLAALQKARALYEPMISEEEEKRLYPKISRELDSFLAGHQQALAMMKEARFDDARRLMAGPLAASFLAVMTDLDKLVQVNVEGAARAGKHAESTYQSARMAIAAAIVVAVALGLVTSSVVARMIAQPIRAAVGVAQRVAEGDLTAHIRAESQDETGQLLEALETMNGSLQKLVSEVRSGTDMIATASDEIAAGNQDLSARTEQQAGSLEETAASVEELTSTVRQNADHAQHADKMAREATGVAQQGGMLVSEVVGTMSSIEESARRIEDIITTIDGIAFQTNILALNAAVEAARAGEAGRGFAVVAQEVRNLAQRSASAAKEIKTLIDDSVDKVGKGAELVRQTGETMEKIVTSIQSVGQVISEISLASAEQASGVAQVNEAITQMDHSTQQNAALVEQAAAAADAMRNQAAGLKQTVSQFKLDANQLGASAPRRPAGRGKPALSAY
ncbi:methyl-accepting chemotaxis protein [Massilia sp. TS11]|uniref:methyl-accepting chemotaxis protein n=1 Tax=Massilia sp. TS11 TaxID=2908003 RepID=UPI0027D9C761|nr:methyl-accepting chemotaxis protein [Massilia sp. TS11]